MDIPNHFSDLAHAAFHVAREAGSLLKAGYQKDFDIIPKGMKNDVVTSYDYASEQLIVTRLSDQFPTHSFLCEERGAMPHPEGSICWMIDPLDGTVNFAHHVPLFCVTIAACQENEVVCGVTYAPILEELFIAEKGKGAYLNGKRLKVSSSSSIHAAYIGTSLSFNLHTHPTHSIEVFSKIARLGSPMRAFGSTALNMCYIAAGRLDAYWSLSGAFKAWDVATGILMINEAGGTVSQANGNSYKLEGSASLLASNGKLHEELLQFFNL
ncbi:inositol monophosphatase family protein [Parachlamydia sp. AcF125]|uniref:inositol monophosphatase family protein n=1 Tax=Parachlamydia sp. AcF125 TaxID=2795736 RepID=UPI001BC9ACA3|nr:inositol monophosphatase family protein [Parachlamydia sp. AcF125]MBS4168217.1 Inositol-1-monophosphatase [Parachlamydia sp. AcF125]